MSELKVVFLGDIMGRIGRNSIKTILPKIKEQYQPDLIIANAENLAHGKGVTADTLKEMMEAGVDFFTSGDHVWDNAEGEQLLLENKLPLIRPANYPEGVAGDGYRIIEVGTKKVLIVNLLGRVFFKVNTDCPFRKLEQILEETKHERLDAIIVDLHAEVTSEKNSLGRYFDGKVSLIVGTHTHVQTADDQILPNGTAYITDVGFTGFKHGSLGVALESVMKNFLYQTPQTHEIPEHGICQVNGIFAIIKSENKLASHIERIQHEVEV